ncbi:MAG: DOMON-like domain-containing protein [Betaproteobacteria bacterium]|nr:DOMON-like domain-containing protein [Betaproteobacteria bacterium]
MLTLIPHPDARTVAPGSIAVRLERAPDGGLLLGYRLAADPSALRIAPPAAAQRADGLWRHTCFEAFVAVAGEPAYREFNFSPSGQWAAYEFRSYRESAAAACGPAPRLAVRVTAGGLELDVALPAAALAPPQLRLRLGLSAVVEARDGTLSYWALRHPPGRPDFHHHDAFALELPPAGRALGPIAKDTG